MPELQVCTRCKEEKPIDMFHFSNVLLGTRRKTCKQCRSPYGPDNPKPVRFRDGKKLCTLCGEFKELDSFGYATKLLKDGSHGIRARCNACLAEIAGLSRMSKEALERARARDRSRIRDRNEKYSSDFKSRLWSEYGMTVQEYDELVQLQSGCCGICGGSPGKHRLNIDHCHTTGKVRGLLCGACNRMLGLAHDNPDTLIEAAAYLAIHSSASIDDLSPGPADEGLYRVEQEDCEYVAWL